VDNLIAALVAALDVLGCWHGARLYSRALRHLGGHGLRGFDGPQRLFLSGVTDYRWTSWVDHPVLFFVRIGGGLYSVPIPSRPIEGCRNDAKAGSWR
jgi:hypothetical protein